jgi:hypothetical protein
MDPIEVPIPIVPFASVRGLSFGISHAEVARHLGVADVGAVAPSVARVVHVDPTTQIATVAICDDDLCLDFVELDWTHTPRLFAVRAIVAGVEIAGRRTLVEREMTKLGHAMLRDENESTTYCLALGVLWVDREGTIVRVAAWRDPAYWEDMLATLPTL